MRQHIITRCRHRIVYYSIHTHAIIYALGEWTMVWNRDGDADDFRWGVWHANGSINIIAVYRCVLCLSRSLDGWTHNACACEMGTHEVTTMECDGVVGDFTCGCSGLQ